MRFNYITYDQLRADVCDLAVTARKYGVRGIIGIPRSGLLVATMLGLHMHLPVASAMSIDHPRAWYAGGRLSGGGRPPGPWLLVDDSYYVGNAMAQNLAAVRAAVGDMNILTAAVYTASEDAAVDMYQRVVPGPRYFEWNLFGHIDMGAFMLDIDGVLCKDPPVVDDDSPTYGAALSDAEPLYLPVRPVLGLVTHRLERWRSATQSWLAKHDVYYGRLIMAEFPTAEARRRNIGKYGEWKGDVYKASEALMFIESSLDQAAVIFQRARKPVLCPAAGRVFQ